MSDDDRSDDERDVKEGDDVASDSVWQTTDIRNSKPTWSAFQGSNLISSGSAQLSLCQQFHIFIGQSVPLEYA
jgi:hypothetical protein